MTVVFGLEDVGGYGRSLAVYLVENHFLVKEVNAALSNWKRKSYAMTEKHDSWDAENIAKLLLDELGQVAKRAPTRRLLDSETACDAALQLTGYPGHAQESASHAIKLQLSKLQQVLL